jgi:hypothetical protein
MQSSKSLLAESSTLIKLDGFKSTCLILTENKKFILLDYLKGEKKAKERVTLTAFHFKKKFL